MLLLFNDFRSSLASRLYLNNFRINWLCIIKKLELYESIYNGDIFNLMDD
ncbi:MAG: hypothetical protein ACI8UG_000606 [Gammaproteobacteria bacterium]|jgi:hypothetical protein